MFDNVGNEQKLMIAVLIIAIIIGSGVSLFKKYFSPPSKPIVIEGKNSCDSNGIVVHISGAVRKCGVYSLSNEDRVVDAIKMAGGIIERADLDKVNLAEKPKDGQKIIIPYKNAASDNAGATININSADESQLRKIQGVGPNTAKKIIEYREKNGGFKTIEDLKKIGGFGAKKLEKIKGSISVF